MRRCRRWMKWKLEKARQVMGKRCEVGLVNAVDAREKETTFGSHGDYLTVALGEGHWLFPYLERREQT
jgi:hypothetical protein